MKKSILLIVMFMVLFFGGSSGVSALTCKIGEEGCTPENIENELYDMGYSLICLYEVKMNNEKGYYNYISRSSAGNYFAGSTISKIVYNTNLGDDGFLLGDAYNEFFNNKLCPLYSYIDTDANNQVCFDNDSECKNNGEAYDAGTNFNSTASSKLLSPRSYGETNVGFNNVCDAKLESGYDGMCRYTSEQLDAYSILYYNNSSTLLLDVNLSINESYRLKLGNPFELTVTGSYYARYQNNIAGFTGNCPEQLYLKVEQGLNTSYRDWYSENPENFNNAEVYTFSKTNCVDDGIYDGDDDKTAKCDDLISPKLREMINDAMNIIRIGVPILLIGLITYDFATAVLAGDEKKIKTAQGRVIKRIIIAVVIFFVPTLVNLIFNIVNEVWENQFDVCRIDTNE